MFLVSQKLHMDQRIFYVVIYNPIQSRLFEFCGDKMLLVECFILIYSINSLLEIFCCFLFLFKNRFFIYFIHKLKCKSANNLNSCKNICKLFNVQNLCVSNYRFLSAKNKQTKKRNIKTNNLNIISIQYIIFEAHYLVAFV